MKKRLRCLLIFCLPIFLIKEPVFAASLSNELQALEKVTDVLFTIEKFFHKEVDLKKCVEATLQRGISECLDPFSQYLTKEEAASREEEISGHLSGGIGIRLMGRRTKEHNEIIIVAVLKNTPAEKTGLKPGDVIVAISSTSKKENQISAHGLAMNEVVKLIRGEIGTEVLLIISRENEIKEFTLARADIKLVTVEYKMLDSQAGYLQIIEFGSETGDDFQAAVSSLSASGMKVMVLDLRNNPGGLLRSVLNINSLFAKDGASLLYTAGRNDLPHQYVPNDDKIGQYKNLKVVVLINEYSASAAEIMAGWLKNDCGAPLIGKKTFGKGSVQINIELNDGSVLHLTVAEYFVGKDRIKVHEIGISPTIELENPKSVKSEADDLQLKRALEEANKLIR